MRAGPRVFISFSQHDKELAKRLHDDLRKHGAEVFQFQESARPGSDAWEQVYQSIKTADCFIALLSQHAVDSNPMLKEIRYADHCHVNNDWKPCLIPAMLEPVEKPPQLATMTELQFGDYEEGLGELVQLLELEHDAAGREDDNMVATRPQLSLDVSPHPHRVRPGEMVIWTATVKNTGEVPARNLVAHLGRSLIANSLDLDPGESKSFESRSVYRERGKKARRLIVKGAGIVATASAVARVSERASKSREAGNDSPTPDLLLPAAQFRRRLAEGWAPVQLGGSRGKPVSTAPTSEHSAAAAGSSIAEFITEVLPTALLLAVSAVVFSVALFWGVPALAGLLPTPLWWGWLESIVVWCGDHAWIGWIGAGVFVLWSAASAWIIAAEDACDAHEYVLAALASLVVIPLSLIWFFFFVRALGPTVVTLSTITIALIAHAAAFVVCLVDARNLW